MTEQRQSDSKNYTIVHVDDYLVVVNKGPGLLTVPAYDEPCLVDQLEQELDRLAFGRYRLAVVHRLDRQTSGLLVFARHPKVAALLAKQFAGHSVEREYAAIVAGTLLDDVGSFDGKVDDKRAVTHYTVTKRWQDATAIAVQLETGRRNQIRIHFAEAHHPVIGDTRFEPDTARHRFWPAPSLALHARILGFKHPATKAIVSFEASLPDTFTNFTQQAQQTHT